MHAEEVWSKGDLARVDEIFHPQTINHWAPAGLPPGAEGIKALVAGARSVIPDLVLASEGIWVAGDMLFARGVFSGTHTGGAYYGIEPTGRTLRWNVLAMFRYQDGLLVEEWALSDEMEAFRLLTVQNPGATLHVDAYPRRHNSLPDAAL